MGMGDDAGMDGDDDVLSHYGILSDDESIESSDVKDDTISLISNANSTKTTRTKKRVQFLPDDFLVRVREIPPRSNKSSSGSDGSANDSSDSDSSDADSESEDMLSERDTPSPAAPTESQNKFATMPPLKYTAKGSYTVSKPSGTKSASPVAKITGIDPTTIPQSSNRIKSPPKRTRRSPSPKLEKRSKKTPKNNDNNKVNNQKGHPQNDSAKSGKKRTPLRIKDGKISPPPFSKQQKNALTPKSNGSIKLCQRRGSNTPTIKTLPVKKPPHSTITTSLTALSTSTLSSESSLDRVSRAMQSLTMGKLYTVDGFIFPPHHAGDLHLPDLTSTSKSENFDHPISLTQKRPSNDLGSPRRSYQEVSSFHQTPPQSANRKRRYYAWQMANGSIQNALNTTPSISQLWDSPGRSLSDATDKFPSNGR